MRIAIISDIHSNFEALTVALESLAKEKVEKIVCLGDIIGYGASPVECIELIRDQADITLLGNHDEAVIDVNVVDNFNSAARTAIFWTLAQLSKEHTDFIKGLSVIERQPPVVYTHASPSEPKKWSYISSSGTAAKHYESLEAGEICFVGHSHIPGIYTESQSFWSPDSTPVVVEANEKAIINVGSIGQPRDGDTRLSFALFDTEKREVKIIRLPYDIKTAGSRMKEAGLPPYLAERIESGR